MFWRKTIYSFTYWNVEYYIESKMGRRVWTAVGFGLNVPWGQFGIHGTLNPYSVGWASSHGCIRMNNKDVAELYEIIAIGTKVTIVDGVYGSFGKGLRTLKSGMYGADVLEIQKKLKKLGFFNRKSKWKIWGRNRKSSTKILQRKWLIFKKNNRYRITKTYGV